MAQRKKSKKVRYAIGDEVWFIDDNQVQSRTITGIVMKEDEPKYYFGEYSNISTVQLSHGRSQEILFPSKQDLLESL